MAKCLLINPANRLFVEHFNLRADMRADIRIRAGISAHVPWRFWRHKIKMADIEDVFDAFQPLWLLER